MRLWQLSKTGRVDRVVCLTAHQRNKGYSVSRLWSIAEWSATQQIYSFTA